ncbi:MAG: DUF4419 domain-containing protein [Fibrobacterales bacterium]
MKTLIILLITQLLFIGCLFDESTNSDQTSENDSSHHYSSSSSEEQDEEYSSSNKPVILQRIIADDSFLTSRKVTFAVDTVEPITEILGTLPYDEVVIKKMVIDRNVKERKSFLGEDAWDYTSDELLDPKIFPDTLPNRVVEATAYKEIDLVPTSYHAFMEALRRAYANHYNFVISPDMIWLLISQGFATHINENSEDLRSQFVDFDGKKKLNIRRDSFSKGSLYNDWAGTFEEFSDSIEANTGTELLDLVTGKFSTTTPIEKAAFQITLMDAMKSYFSYSMTTGCGIPFVTLEGTTADWELVKSKAEALRDYDLAWWINELSPILDQFIAASKGEADADFWKGIYVEGTIGCGNVYIAGWILLFFPYMEYDDGFERFIKEEWPIEYTYDDDTGEEVAIMGRSAETDILPSGLSQAPVLWDYFGTKYSMEYISGFVGYRQDLMTGALRPEISWAVVDQQVEPSQEDIDIYENGGDSKYLKGK